MPVSHAVRDRTAGNKNPRRATPVPPPPFRPQRKLTLVVLAVLLATVLATLLTGWFVKVPRIASATAITLPQGGDSQSVLVLFPASLDGQLHNGTAVKLRLPGVPQDTQAALSRVDKPMKVAQLAKQFMLPAGTALTLTGSYVPAVAQRKATSGKVLAPGTSGTALATVGHRRLLELFIGRGVQEGT